MEQFTLPDSKQQIQIINDLEQEKIVDQLLIGFESRCELEKVSRIHKGIKFSYTGGGYTIWKTELEEIFIVNSRFSFYPFVNSQGTIDYSMNRMPLGKQSKFDEKLKLNRVVKILILLWYLALVNNIDIVFKADQSSMITNKTNKANYGFSQKVFGNKMSVIINGENYSWQISVGD